MPASSIPRPVVGEYDEYFERYISLVPFGDFGEISSAQLDSFPTFMRSIPAEKGDYAYAPGKWTVKEVLGHLVDTERVFMYRTLHIARGDVGELLGFDQDAWVANGGWGDRTLEELCGEWIDVRRASISLLDALPSGVTERLGVANGSTCSASSVAYIPVGHVTYHERLLRSDYGLT